MLETVFHIGREVLPAPHRERANAFGAVIWAFSAASMLLTMRTGRFSKNAAVFGRDDTWDAPEINLGAAE